MSLVNWLVVLLPVAFIVFMGFYSRRYVCQVADFLSAGRVCGRYVISVSGVATALSIIGLVGYVETHYATGFGLFFWAKLSTLATIIYSLSGFCSYRFRQTRAMSFGQFLEMRYSRKFRMFASGLRSLSEMLANMIMPAIAARFFIYYLDLPHRVNIFGLFSIPTFSLVVLIVLTLAITIIWCGGTLALIITDSIQGMICYPLMAIFVGFILIKFDWNSEIVPVMTARVEGQSFLDPYDVEQMREFNVFYVAVTLLSHVWNQSSWLGAGTSSAARSPHEGKMAGLLGNFRGAMGTLFYLMIAVILITVFNHKDFKEDAHRCRLLIANRVGDELLTDTVRDNVNAELGRLAPQVTGESGNPSRLSMEKNLDTRYLDVAKQEIVTGYQEDPALANKQYQQFRSLFFQMMTAVGMREILPKWLVGLFCLLMVMAMVSTDDTRIFSASLTITQDVVMPLLKKQLTPEQHILVIRLMSVGVGVFFFIGSYFMSQLDYISMFVTTCLAMWAGAGSMTVFGLYSRFGTTKGAWASMLSSVGVAICYILMKEHWTSIYQFLKRHGWEDNLDRFLRACSAPFEPWIKWRVVPEKYPINAYENLFFTMFIAFVVYVVVSRLTCKRPFNLDRMLHRGKYNVDGTGFVREKVTFRNLWQKFIGITPEYSTGDKVTAWLLFAYSICYGFFGTFIFVIIWNAIYKWPVQWWGYFFLIESIIVPGVLAVVCAVVFTYGGIRDLIQMFRDLEHRVGDALDNGAVEGNVSLADRARFEKIDSSGKGSDDAK